MVELADIVWDADGTPRSRRFDDVYFSRKGGLEEARQVFLAGCGLPEAWRGRQRFTVAELGFGSGLNLVALLQLWGGAREPGDRLNIFSVEAWPMARQDAARALSAFPELADLTGPLLAAWPQAPGFHRIEFPALGAVLDLAVMEAAEALEAWSGRADAWFLDGFSPARNPQMWREEVLALLAARSAPGARAASFTVAGAVRRGLQAQGFAVAKRPGFGGKAERLEAVRPGVPAPGSARPPRVLILGAGIAGAALARAFRAEGLPCLVLDPAGPGAGASGNPAALVTPRLDAGGGPPARLHAQAFRRALQLYPEAAIIARGALQLEAAPRDAARFDRIAAEGPFAPGALERVAPAGAGERLGEAVEAGGLWLRDGLVVEPRRVLETWLKGCEARRERPEAQAGDIVCLAAGPACAALAEGLPLEPIRGQASFSPWPERPTAAAWGGYVIPTREGLLFGATHDRGDDRVELRPEDHGRNLETLSRKRPMLAQGLAGAALEGRAAVRAASPDRLPLAGRLPGAANVYVLTGLGGRGFCLAPLLAEHVAALALGAPSPLPRDLARAVAPERFSPRSGSAGHPVQGQENAS